MHYFIDGYNLMFRILRAGDDLQMQRASIILDLNRKIQVVGLDVTIVFDAQYQSGESTRSHLKHLEIYFTNQGETADELILQKLQHEKNPRQQTIVTSDKKLAWLARRRGALTETVEDFLKSLNNRCKNKLKNSPSTSARAILPPPKKVIPVSTKKPSPEECFEYYLEEFEANFQEMAKMQPVKELKSPPKKKKKAKTKELKQDEGLSNMERWVKAFERNLEDDET